MRKTEKKNYDNSARNLTQIENLFQTPINAKDIYRKMKEVKLYNIPIVIGIRCDHSTDVFSDLFSHKMLIIVGTISNSLRALLPIRNTAGIK